MGHTKLGGYIIMTESNSRYNIVYASDDGFAEVMGVSILSLFENNQKAEDIRITILDSGISDINKQKVEEVCRRYHRPLPRWIKATDIEEHLEMSVKTDRGSIAQYARIFLTDIFDESVKRVLYLDCDTLIVDSVYELWNIDLKGNTIAALKDAFSKYYRKNVDLESNDIMFNSGVMLINLDKWRNDRVEDKLASFIKKKNGKVQQGDQGALNAILSKNTQVLETKFNMVSIFYDLAYKDILLYRKPVDFYTIEEINSGKKNPVIVHYTSSFYNRRPWIKESNHLMANNWLAYKLDSPWKSTDLRFDNRKGIKIMMFTLYHKLPSSISLRIAGFFQSYVRPLKTYMMER